MQRFISPKNLYFNKNIDPSHAETIPAMFTAHYSTNILTNAPE